jgi:glycosyltransferase involved in cell wall biosynthesis
MRLDLVFPKLPPALDGIGDHTAHLASALSARDCTVRVLTAQRDWAPLPNVEVERAFHTRTRRGILDLVDCVHTRSPDWLLVQFEQFSYGRWGLNPFLPLALHRLRSAATQTAVMFHEDYMPATDLRSAVIGLWQKPQFWTLGRAADVAFFATEPRTRRYDSLFSDTSVHHLPVGSNIPDVGADRARERDRLNVDADDFVVGLFGSAHASRLLSYADAAVTACARDRPGTRVLYVGPDGPQVRTALTADVPVTDAGALPAEDVSRCFAAMDLYLAPFRKGVSTRRGSFLTGLQHGVATVTTQGRATGPLLSARHEEAFLAPDCSSRRAFVDAVRRLTLSPDARPALAQRGQAFYRQHFSWPTVAERLLRALNAPTHTPAPRGS